jgi:AcrR family transcriptional regulator
MKDIFVFKKEYQIMREKENRRVKLTKTMLKDSLIELLQKQPINRITVKEICENADINRSTFYVYYTDQYGLLAEIEDEIILKTKEYV